MHIATNLNGRGIVKLTDFSHAVRVTPLSRMRGDVVGVLQWQAPEMRQGLYDVRKVDVWSLGATVWGMAETEPPFANIEDVSQVPDRLPPLSRAQIFSKEFHDFPSPWSSPAYLSRPTAKELLKSPFIHSSCGHATVRRVLAECQRIEHRVFRGRDADAQSSTDGILDSFFKVVI